MHGRPLGLLILGLSSLSPFRTAQLIYILVWGTKYMELKLLCPQSETAALQG